MMRPRPSSVEQVHSLGKDVIVHQSSEHAEKAHEENDISAVEESSDDLSVNGQSVTFLNILKAASPRPDRPLPTFSPK
jgi:hypothetical protein